MKRAIAAHTILFAMGLSLIPTDRATAQIFTVLHGFTPLSGNSSTNYDGSYPTGRLVADSSGNRLYGTANLGGSGYGTVFAINTDGTGFTNLHSFNHDNDGSGPDALVLLGNSLYGVARRDGNFDNGTVFRLSFTPQLILNRSEADVILTWPTNVAGFDYSGFTLHSTTNLASAVWSADSLTPTVVNGQNTVTNPATEPQKFFRLKPQ